MKPTEFRTHIVKPALEYLRVLNPALDSDVAADLLVGTAWHESAGMKYAKQVNGPALGAFQIEPATHTDVYVNFLAFKPAWRLVVANAAATIPSKEDQLISNLFYATIIARLVYWRSPIPLPHKSADATTYVVSLGEVWKEVYNTAHGKGTVDQFVEHFPVEVLR